MSRCLRGVEYVPAGEFSAWLQGRFAVHLRRAGCGQAVSGMRQQWGSAVDALCSELGWSGDAGTRRLYRYRNQLMESARGKTVDGRKKVYTEPATTWRRDVVEDALHHAGVPFEWIYPQIVAAEDVPLEPDVTCWTCREMVTPIRGVCPWCETVLRFPDEDAWAA